MPPRIQMKQLDPLKAIRYNCLDCSGGSQDEVAKCELSDKCALWPYRFGVRPRTRERILKKREEAKNRELS
jgi:hypothetical protein